MMYNLNVVGHGKVKFQEELSLGNYIEFKVVITLKMVTNIISVTTD